MALDENYWSSRYNDADTPWDMGQITTPIKEYIDSLKDKSLNILVPGAGTGHEPAYIYKKGFKNVKVIDISELPLQKLKANYPDFPEENLHHQDFFLFEGEFDLIVEQTFFCALNPQLRTDYAQKMHDLLKPQGILAGVLFNFEGDDGPPFGGNKEEYLTYFEPLFEVIKMEECYNSVGRRAGKELFIQLKKRV